MTAFPSALPSARAYPLRGGPVLRWGILAPGDIAKDFVHALHTHTDQRVEAVASRSAERAEQFATRHSIPRAYGDHQHLVDDPAIDIVYVAAPHTEHARLALMAIAAGKHVLIEKPIGVTAAEARQVRDAARAAGVFAMEGMWTRYLPQTDVMMQLVDDGVLGDIRLVLADFATIAPTDPQGRNYNPTWRAARCSTSASTRSGSASCSSVPPTGSTPSAVSPQPGSTRRPPSCSSSIPAPSRC